MLSVQFLPKDKPLKESEKYLAAAMTANGVAETVTGKVDTGLPETADEKDIMLAQGVAAPISKLFGLVHDLVLWRPGPGHQHGVHGGRCAQAMDRCLLDRITESSKSGNQAYQQSLFLRLAGLCVRRLFMLNFVDATQLLVWSTIIYNYALGFSCIHVIFINLTLLPRELHPPKSRIAVLAFGGFFFTFMAVISMLATFRQSLYHVVPDINPGTRIRSQTMEQRSFIWDRKTPSRPSRN